MARRTGDTTLTPMRFISAVEVGLGGEEAPRAVPGVGDEHLDRPHGAGGAVEIVVGLGRGEVGGDGLDALGARRAGGIRRRR